MLKDKKIYEIIKNNSFNYDEIKKKTKSNLKYMKMVLSSMTNYQKRTKNKITIKSI